MRDIIIELFDEACHQSERDDVKAAIYTSIVRPLALYTASQLRIPLILIAIFLLLLIAILVRIWWSISA